MTLEVNVVPLKRFVIFRGGFGGDRLGFRFRWRLGCYFFPRRLLLHHLRVWYMFFNKIKKSRALLLLRRCWSSFSRSILCSSDNSWSRVSGSYRLGLREVGGDNLWIFSENRHFGLNFRSGIFDYWSNSVGALRFFRFGTCGIFRGGHRE